LRKVSAARRRPVTHPSIFFRNSHGRPIQRNPRKVLKECTDLLKLKAQILGPDFRHLTFDTNVGKRQARIAPRDHNEMKRFESVFQKFREQAVQFFISYYFSDIPLLPQCSNIIGYHLAISRKSGLSKPL